MDLQELKIRLGISIEDTSMDKYLQYKLSDAVSFIETVTKSSVKSLGDKVNQIIEDYVRYEVSGSRGIASESIGGMSQTFESSTEMEKALLDKMRRLGLLKIRVIPFKRC